MKTDTSPDTLAIPPELLLVLQAEAEDEQRPALAILDDAVKQYVRAKRRDRQVFRTEDLSAAELTAITSGGMDVRHNHLNAELE